MTQNEVNTFAAKSLIDRAMQAKTQRVAYMLIDTAFTLDETLNTTSIKKCWLEQWLTENQNRNLSVTL